jgi:hypothetical protein
VGDDPGLVALVKLLIHKRKKLLVARTEFHRGAFSAKPGDG